MPLPNEVLEQIDEEYRDHASLNDINDVAALAKSYVETKAMVGNSIRIPGKDAGPEAYNEYLEKLINNDPTLMLKPDFANEDQSTEFFRTIGMPEAADKYTNPEDMQLNDEVEAEMRGIAHDLKLTNAQYKKLMAAFSERQVQTVEMTTEQFDSGIAELKGKWGMAFDDRIQAARQANEDFYPGRDFDTLTGPERESLYNISHAMTGKSAPVAGDAPGVPTKMTPEEAHAQADEIMKRIHAPDSDLSHDEKMKLQYKRIELLRKHGKYREAAA